MGSKINLPIDVVAGTIPPRFRWKQRISTPVGNQVIEYINTLPPTVESAVVELIVMVKDLAKLNQILVEKLERATSAPTTTSVIPIKKTKGG